MSEVFFKDLLSLFLHFFNLVILFFGMAQFLMLYIITQNIVFYYVYIVALFSLFFLSSKCYARFKRFQQQLYLFFPMRENNNENMRISYENEELNTLLKWANGSTWRDLFDNPMECNRFIRKHLKTLLLFYYENKHKENT